MDVKHNALGVFHEGGIDQRLIAFNRAIREAQELHDPQAIFAVVGETLEQVGLKSIFASLSTDHGKLSIQSIYQSHPEVLPSLERLLHVKLVGLSLPPETASMLEAATKDGKTIFVKDSKEILGKIFPSSPARLLEQAVEMLGGSARWVIAPVGRNGTISDMLMVWSPNLSEGDMPMVTAFANQAVIAVENAKLRRKLRDGEEQRSSLVRTILDAQEAERERICLEVHDGVTQTLASAFQYLQAFNSSPDTQISQARHLTNKAGSLVKQAIQEAREVINSLQPATLSRLGLVSTLRQEMHDLSTETGWKIDFKADSFRLSKDVEIALYRVIHEALTNARKHARTNRVRVKLKQSDKEVVAQIRDFGVGFELKPSWLWASQQGTGLLSMHRRAELTGGICHIESSPGQGTTVTVKVPIREGNEHGDHKGIDR